MYYSKCCFCSRVHIMPFFVPFFMPFTKKGMILFHLRKRNNRLIRLICFSIAEELLNNRLHTEQTGIKSIIPQTPLIYKGQKLFFA